MDLIYMNAAKEDVGVLLHYDLDLAFGADENNFSCTIDASEHCCKEGYFLYIEGTEYGGIIDSVLSDTERGEVSYHGRTWQGILGSRVVMPLRPSDASTNGVTVKTTDTNGSLMNKYLVLSGDANKCIQYILDRVKLSALFTVSTEASAVISGYQFDRYTDAYTGICKMLKSAGLKLLVEFKDGMVVLSAVTRYDYSQDEEFDSDSIGFRLKKNYKTVNHLVCLGSGELADRMVVHLYADALGNISQTQTLTGEDEYASVFDYPNAESEEELVKSGTIELKALWEQDELSVSFDPEEDLYGVGDIVGAYDNVTKISVSAEIIKKIVTIQNGHVTISYEVGEK